MPRRVRIFWKPAVDPPGGQGSGGIWPLLYMLGIPAIVPAVVAATPVVGEREQGTLEPVLTTPICREEFLLAKDLAVIVPPRWRSPTCGTG